MTSNFSGWPVLPTTRVARVPLILTTLAVSSQAQFLQQPILLPAVLDPHG